MLAKWEFWKLLHSLTIFFYHTWRLIITTPSLSLWNWHHHPQTYFQWDKKKPRTQSFTDPELVRVSRKKKKKHNALDLLEPEAMPATDSNNDRDDETSKALKMTILPSFVVSTLVLHMLAKWEFSKTCTNFPLLTPLSLSLKIKK